MIANVNLEAVLAEESGHRRGVLSDRGDEEDSFFRRTCIRRFIAIRLIELPLPRARYCGVRLHFSSTQAGFIIFSRFPWNAGDRLKTPSNSVRGAPTRIPLPRSILNSRMLRS